MSSFMRKVCTFESTSTCAVMKNSMHTFHSDINCWPWQRLSLTLWFVSNRSSHPFLMRPRLHTPKSSSDAGGMTDGNDACKPAHTHMHTCTQAHTHTHPYLSERECFFMCWCQMSVHSQSHSLNISPRPKQCQDRNAGSTLHCRQEKEKTLRRCSRLLHIYLFIFTFNIIFSCSKSLNCVTLALNFEVAHLKCIHSEI